MVFPPGNFKNRARLINPGKWTRVNFRGKQGPPWVNGCPKPSPGKGGNKYPKKERVLPVWKNGLWFVPPWSKGPAKKGKPGRSFFFPSIKKKGITGEPSTFSRENKEENFPQALIFPKPYLWKGMDPGVKRRVFFPQPERTFPFSRLERKGNFPKPLFFPPVFNKR